MKNKSPRYYVVRKSSDNRVSVVVKRQGKSVESIAGESDPNQVMHTTIFGNPKSNNGYSLAEVDEEKALSLKQVYAQQQEEHFMQSMAFVLCGAPQLVSLE
ncbi:MAG: hypothetical protein KKB31_05195 [Nanoarchaeota archaeon]|nr:hypothetical protein [Nanoarchaeota archaeon]